MRVLGEELTTFIPELQQLFDENVVANYLDALKEILSAQETKDYVLMADMIEMRLLPALYDTQAAVCAELGKPAMDYFLKNIVSLGKLATSGALKEKLIAWKNSVKDLFGYEVEFTNCGRNTVRKRKGDKWFYMHSNMNPVVEAEHFADAYVEENVLSYTVVGFGFGYHIRGILQKDARVTVKVVEPDINVLGLAFIYEDLADLIESGRLEIVVSKDLVEIAGTEGKLVIHYPTMMTLEDRLMGLVEEYFKQASSVEEQKCLLRDNFYYNSRLGDEAIDNIRNCFAGKTVVYIGGGPSAQSKLEMIKRLKAEDSEVVCICAGTVLRKLVSLGFEPDFVIITDPQESMIRQTQNVCVSKCCMLYLATASRMAVQAFAGRRFIFYQNGFDASVEVARRNGFMTFNTGGSVSTTAVELALSLGCRKLITTGLDLSFPGDEKHAFGLDVKASEDGYQMTVDIDGNEVKTTSILTIYKKWIEKRLVGNAIPCVNVTDGVRIEGMENVKEI